MRKCPVCSTRNRIEIFSTTYQIPDGWPLPSEITWYTCDNCSMFYGDGDFSQSMLNEYYRRFYGYGVNNPINTDRLRMDAISIGNMLGFDKDAVIVDFGGSGDDGKSILVETLHKTGFVNAVCIGPDEPMPANCDVIYASHVIEHIYDMISVMDSFVDALSPDGLLIIDVPNAVGLLNRWKMPMLDFNTKHINHFTLRDLLALGKRYGFEMVKMREYELENAPAFHVHFKRMDLAQLSRWHVQANVSDRIEKLSRSVVSPVNVWGLGDITWHILSQVDLDVLDYIDNDPAFQGQTFKGQRILERPTNSAPIVIFAQGQRARLIENIRKMGIDNPIVEI